MKTLHLRSDGTCPVCSCVNRLFGQRSVLASGRARTCVASSSAFKGLLGILQTSQTLMVIPPRWTLACTLQCHDENICTPVRLLSGKSASREELLGVEFPGYMHFNMYPLIVTARLPEDAPTRLPPMAQLVPFSLRITNPG